MENTNKNKLFNLINERFKKFELNNDKNFSEIGYVVTVNDGVIYASGLQNVEINELVKFQNGVQGVVLSLEPEFVGIVALGDYHNILENTIVKRLKKIISIPFSENYIGKIIDPFGKILDSGALSTKNTSKQKFLPIESSIGNFLARRKINESLQTGILLIDAIFPIGKGQRQLIVGDRQTGKTTIAIDTIINQKEKNVFCIYVSIGQKNSTLASISETLKKHGALKHTIIISSPASDYPGMKYVAPFSGMSIAEE
jgi:F-type H+-transporting ATPase subunit alpha